MGQTDAEHSTEQMPTNNTPTEPNLNENTIADQWKSFKLTRSIRRAHANEHDFQLLKNYKTSILGDICIQIGDEEYILDRTLLASNSKNFDYLISPEKNITVDDINKLVQCKDIRFRQIVDIIYGNDVRSILTQENFIHLLTDMSVMGLETDLEIFKEFIVKSKTPPNDRMLEIFNFISGSTPKFNYLLPAVSQYFSDNLLEICKQEKCLLHLSTDQFIFVLLHKSDNSLEKQSIGRVCAEWICHDYQHRIEALKDLVNATKYRYGLQPYCDFNPNEFLPKDYSSNEVDIQQVEEYFNELLSYFGDVKFEPPAELNENLDKMKSGVRLLFPNDQVNKWMWYMEKELLCDVAIDVQGIIFKLHRIKLSSVSGYFYDLFTNPTESLAYEIDNSDAQGEPKMSQHTFDGIDPVTFKSIVEYIYKQEIEITSATECINLLKGSQLLKMHELYKNCCSKLLEIVPNLSSGMSAEIFQFICQNEINSEIYTAMAKRIVELWPKCNEIPQLLNIPLDTLKKIVASPHLKIANPDEMLDLCSKWIFHDIQNRYKNIIEVARAINRNTAMNREQLSLDLEIPENSIDHSQQYVKQQLIRILSTTKIVPVNTINVQNDAQKPCFLTLNHNNSLCVLDANSEEIIQFKGVYKTYGFTSSATLINNQLFILFRNDDYHFQLYDFSSNRMILLAADPRMAKKFNDFAILNCNNDVYYFGEKIALKYSIELNRWTSFLNDDEGTKEDLKQYTSDGKKLYKVYSIPNEAKTDEWIHKASYYNFEQNAWMALPDIPISTKLYYGLRKVNIINRELSVLIGTKTFAFSWLTQVWTSISHKNFYQFNECGQNITYIADYPIKNEVYTYSPILNKFSYERKLDVKGVLMAIHKIS